MLQVFSRLRIHKRFCLSHLFTYTQFEDGSLGLSYVASPLSYNPGGICSPGSFESPIKIQFKLSLILCIIHTTTPNICSIMYGFVNPFWLFILSSIVQRYRFCICLYRPKWDRAWCCKVMVYYLVSDKITTVGNTGNGISKPCMLSFYMHDT